MNPERAGVLMSIRSSHARNILAGSKTVELRRQVPGNLGDLPVYVYSSGEDKAITMRFRVKEIVSEAPMIIWKRFKDQVCISEAEFFAYYRGATIAHALVLEDVERIAAPVALNKLRTDLGLNAPQSWRYVADWVMNQLS